MRRVQGPEPCLTGMRSPRLAIDRWYSVGKARSRPAALRYRACVWGAGRVFESMTAFFITALHRKFSGEDLAAKLEEWSHSQFGAQDFQSLPSACC